MYLELCFCLRRRTQQPWALPTRVINTTGSFYCDNNLHGISTALESRQGEKSIPALDVTRDDDVK